MTPGTPPPQRTDKAVSLGSVLVMVLSLLSVPAMVTAPAASAAPGPTAPRPSGNVTADALPTTQIDGVAWTQLVMGNRVYVGGSFGTARPAGSTAGVNTVTRKNILAYDISTGELIATFAPTLNSQAFVIARSPDGSKIYVGGDFTTANGAPRSKIAAFNATTGALITTFAPTLNGRVRAIVADGDNVYVGGQFTTANGVARDRLAAFNADGALTGWNPGADAQVYTLLMTPAGDKILAGGSFQNAGRNAAGGLAASYGMVALEPATGAKMPWNATNLIKNAGTNAAILQLTTDGTAIYGNGFVFGAGGNLEGIFSANPGTGDINWVEDCHGDTYSNYPAPSGVVYAASHAHYCGNVGGFPQTTPWTMYYGTAFTKQVTGTLGPDPLGYYNYHGTPSPSMVNWFPFLQPGTFTGQGQAGWSVTGNDQYVVMGGEFTTAGGKPQQGLVRFPVPSIAPNKSGPEANANLKPKLNSLAVGTVTVSWQTTWDRDDLNLKYQVVRDAKTATPVHETTAVATFWNKPLKSFTDTGLVPGRTYSYRVYAVDPNGNTLASPSSTVVVSSTGAIGTYAQAVLDSAPSTYWRFGEPDASSTSTLDWAGSGDGLVGTGVTRNLGSAVGDTNPSFGFNGSSTNLVSTPVAGPAPSGFSNEMWIKTNSTSGGKIVGFGNSQNGNSTSYDRHVFMDKAGKIWFGVHPGSIQTITSTASYNDGKWHQVVTSLSGSGMELHIDGEKVASRADVTNGKAYSGFWRVGGDSLGSWPGTRDGSYFNGQVDDVSIYSTALSSTQIADHYQKAGGQLPNVAPTAEFSTTTANLKVQVDGAQSADSDGSISSYGWNFGDNTAAGGGQVTDHVYAVAGTYTVTLTVTDNRGATASKTREVTVTAAPANVVPVAAFTHTTSGLNLSVDAGTSTDPDGSIAKYEWTFGDGGTALGAAASHTYIAGGPYTVTLKVTDNKGATAVTDKEVTVAPPASNQAPIANFSGVVSGLTLSVDASSSSDPDGTLAAYSWQFGTTGSALGKVATYQFPAPGTYPVTLTVEDNKGATSSKTSDFTVTAPSNAVPFATDRFGRTLATGWGSANVGGAWSTVGAVENLAVANGAGVLNLPAPGSQAGSYLAGSVNTSSDITVKVSASKNGSGPGTYVSVVGRRVNANNQYRARVRFAAGNRVAVSIIALKGSTSEVQIAPEVLLPGSISVGTVFNVRFQVSGTSPTQLKARVWAAGSAEPGDWLLTATDTTAALQVGGTLGFMAYLSGTATNAPVAVKIQEFSAKPVV